MGNRLAEKKNGICLHRCKVYPFLIPVFDGINFLYSNKHRKIDYTFRNLSFSGSAAIGTPLCNSISDVYAMQMYLQYDQLESRQLHIFDNWVRTFAQPEQICEIDVDTSKFRMVRKFSRFFNLPELSLLFSQVSVFHATDKSGLPEFKGYDDMARQESLKKELNTVIDYKALMATNGMNITFHKLRHEFATTLNDLGVPSEYIQKLGGWSSDNIMKSVYTHTTTAKEDEYQSAIDNYFIQAIKDAKSTK